MAPNLTNGSRRYQIVSLTKGNPAVGVNSRLRPAVQLIRLNAPDTIWTVEESGKLSSYRLSVGPYGYTGVFSEKVAGTTHAEQSVEWIAVYREAHDAYTIELLRGGVLFSGWTVTDDSHDSTISLKEIVPQPIKIYPTHYYPNQLFQFIPEDDDE